MLVTMVGVRYEQRSGERTLVHGLLAEKKGANQIATTSHGRVEGV